VHQRRRLIRRDHDTLVEPKRTTEQVLDYLVLCLRYFETPVCDTAGPNPHGDHAKLLEARALLESGDDDSRSTQRMRKVLA
jgi:hypothetical protein